MTWRCCWAGCAVKESDAEKKRIVATNYKLTIEYDGSRYHGWQRQPNGRTIQEEIETAIRALTGLSVRLNGSGRTDAGVHALGQTASFTCETRLSAAQLHSGLNALLPEEIVIHNCEAVPAQFHARYDAISKIYRYRILNRRVPAAIGRHYQWWIRAPLDIPAMQAAAEVLVGRQDFKSFEAAGSPRSHTVRHVMGARIQCPAPEQILFEIEADGFLRGMVRNIVGTLVEVGRGKMEPGRIEQIIAARDRGRAAATAPPHGLFLMRVNY